MFMKRRCKTIGCTQGTMYPLCQTSTDTLSSPTHSHTPSNVIQLIAEPFSNFQRRLAYALASTFLYSSPSQSSLPPPITPLIKLSIRPYLLPFHYSQFFPFPIPSFRQLSHFRQIIVIHLFHPRPFLPGLLPHLSFFLHCKKRLVIFPSKARMSLTKLNKSVTTRLGTGKPLTFFYSVMLIPLSFSLIQFSGLSHY